MTAMLLTLLIFLFWLIVGLAVITALRTRRYTIQNLLLAPTVGISVSMVPIFLLNRAGLPVASFSRPLLLILLLASVGLLLWRPPFGSVRAYRTVLRAYLPFLVVFGAGLMLTGWPMLKFGMEWISYANEDMANYVLGAHHFATHGYFATPTLDAMLNGTDYTQYYWAFVVAGIRLGSELMLAWAIGVTGLSGHQLFMPVIFALHLTLVSATGALTYQAKRSRLAALTACALLCMSAMNGLGTLLQLIAQVSGLGQLISALLLLLSPARPGTRAAAIRQGVLAGIVGTSLFILYPEAAPFLGLSFILYIAVAVLRRRSAAVPGPSPIALGVTAVLGLVMTNSYLLDGASFMLYQAGISARSTLGKDVEAALFPYFLLPSGLANLWGFQSIMLLTGEPWLSGSIVLGALLLAAIIPTCVVLVWRGYLAATVTLVMLVLGMQLMRQGSGFGMFKLSMFIQPFILATLVIGWFSVTRRPALRLLPLLLLGGLSIPSQLAYIQLSYGNGHGLLSSEATLGVNTEMSQIVQSLTTTQGPPPNIMLDTTASTLAKFQATYTLGLSAGFPSKHFFGSFFGGHLAPSVGADTIRTVEDLSEHLIKSQYQATFPWFADGKIPDDVLRIAGTSAQTFNINTLANRSKSSRLDCDYFLSSTSRQTSINRLRNQDAGRNNFVVRKCSEVRDFLIFTDSLIGHDYYTYDSPRELVAINELEPDSAFPGEAFTGLGRRLLFQVVNPSAAPRLALEMTATYKSDGENRLPPAIVIGADRRPLGFVGRGSARVFSPPVAPTLIADHSFLGIDMGVEGQRFPSPRDGLMGLYGTDVPLDKRFITGFARDISLISEEEVSRLTPPASISAFPADLANRNLEYSGVYEDGWISEAAFFGLTAPTGRPTVVARGAVPLIDDPNFTTELRLLVDGQEVARQTLKPGPFEVGAAAPPAAPGATRQRVELQFSAFQQLRGADMRPVAAKMAFVGFEPAPAVVPPPQALQNIPADLAHPGLKSAGVAPDGWLSTTSAFDLLQPDASPSVVVRGQVPMTGDPGFTTELRLLVDGQDVAQKTLGPGDFEIQAPVSPGAAPRRIELRFSNGQQLPAPDGRLVGALLRYAGFEARSEPSQAPR